MHQLNEPKRNLTSLREDLANERKEGEKEAVWGCVRSGVKGIGPEALSQKAESALCSTGLKIIMKPKKPLATKQILV